MTHGATWQDQWARIERWAERVRASRDTPRPDGLGTEGYRDELFALFQAIWHLKDWLINDPALAVTKGQIEHYVFEQGHLGLQAAHDLANGSKHLNLKKPAVDAAQIRNDAAIHVGAGVSHTFYIHLAKDDQEFEAVALAELCVEEWSVFLKQLGLIT